MVTECQPLTPAIRERHSAAARTPAKRSRYITEQSVEANWTPIGTDYGPKLSSAA